MRRHSQTYWHRISVRKSQSLLFCGRRGTLSALPSCVSVCEVVWATCFPVVISALYIECDNAQYEVIFDDLGLMFLLGMPNKNSLKANLLPHHYPQPCLPSTCLCILFCAVAEVMGVSIQEEARGLWSSSSSPRPSSPYAPQLPFRTPPLQPIHLGKLPPPTKKKSGYLLEYLFAIVLRHTKECSLC